MMTKLYAVRDNVAQDIFGGIIRCPNDEVARRTFHDLLAQKESPVASHRGDYDLICLAYMDNHGNLDMDPNDGPNGPQIIARGQDWLDANKEMING